MVKQDFNQAAATDAVKDCTDNVAVRTVQLDAHGNKVFDTIENSSTFAPYHSTVMLTVRCRGATIKFAVPDPIEAVCKMIASLEEKE